MPWRLGALVLCGYPVMGGIRYGSFFHFSQDQYRPDGRERLQQDAYQQQEGRFRMNSVLEIIYLFFRPV